MPLFGVIFDADGVLFDSERQSLEALKVAVDRATGGKIPLSAERLDFLCGRDDDSIVEYLNSRHSLAIETENFRALKLECYRQVIARDPIAPAPGAVALVQALRAENIPYAVATSAIRAKLNLSLESLGLAPLFPILASADEVAAGKPDPAVFLLAAERLGLPPARIVVFEDTPNGIKAANRAGMLSVGVAGTFPREHLAEAAKIIGSLEEVSVSAIRTWLDGRPAKTSPTERGK